jgi:hypothetical protein
VGGVTDPWAGLYASRDQAKIAAEQARLAAEKNLMLTAHAAARSFDPSLAGLFKTELEWRVQTRVDGKSVQSGRELAEAVIALAKQIGWEPAP